MELFYMPGEIHGSAASRAASRGGDRTHCSYCPVKAAVSRGVPLPDSVAVTDVRQAERRFPISPRSPCGIKTTLAPVLLD